MSGLKSKTEDELYGALEYAVSCLCSLRKNYEDGVGLWNDVNSAITEGNSALAKARGEPSRGIDNA